MTSKDDEEWRAFEHEVARLYRALGYSVTEDVLIRQCQIDVLAERSVGGIRPLRIAVEVKHRRTGSVPIQEVRDFIHTATILLTAGEVATAVLVTNTAITRASRALVETDHRIRLSTIDDVRRDLVYNEDHLRNWMLEYERTQVSTRFIDIGLALKGRRASGATVLTLVSTLDADPETNSVVLLADYGAGKTTALERIKYQLLQSHLASKEGRVPFMMSLKGLLDYPDLDSYIRASLMQDLGSQCDLRTFWRLVDEEQYLLLFDGFDEIAVQPSAKDRAAYMARIAPLFFSRSPAILSSRPSYFATRAEYQRLTKPAAGSVSSRAATGDEDRHVTSSRARTLYSTLQQEMQRERGDRPAPVWECKTFVIQPLTMDQVRSYVCALGDEFADLGIADPGDVLDFLEAVYDLSDLVTRPILLQMIVRTVLSGGIDIYDRTRSLGASELYEVYTEIRLEDDPHKVPARRKGLGVTKRRQFAELCAWRMTSLQQLHLSREEAERLARRLEPSPPRVSSETHGNAVERVMTDLRTCSFLTTDDDGNLRFVHKSFLEFFLASKIRQTVLVGSDMTELETPLSQEVLYFLGAMTVVTDSGGSNDLHVAIAEWISRTNRLQDAGRSRESAIRSNLLAVLFYGPQDVSHADLDKGSVPHVRRRTLRIRESHLRDIVFDQLDILELSLEDCKLDQCVLNGSIDATSILRSDVRLELRGAKSVTCEDVVGEMVLRDVSAVALTECDRLAVSVDGGTATSVDLVKGVVSVRGGAIRRLSIAESVSEIRVEQAQSSAVSRIEAVDSLVTIRPGASLGRLVGGADFTSEVDTQFTGVLESCLLLLDFRMPLAFLNNLSLERCVVVGGYLVRSGSQLLQEYRETGRFEAPIYASSLAMSIQVGHRSGGRSDQRKRRRRTIDDLSLSAASFEFGWGDRIPCESPVWSRIDDRSEFGRQLNVLNSPGVAEPALSLLEPFNELVRGTCGAGAGPLLTRFVEEAETAIASSLAWA